MLVTVGETDQWVQGIIDRAKKLKVGNGFADGTDVGPVISPAAKERIEGLIASCEQQGGKILLDGRGAKADGYPEGNWVGPTVLEATTEMDCYNQEIFGPCLTIVKAKTLDEAIALINKNKYGNGAAIFTQSGATARKFERTIEAGQIGINVPIVCIRSFPSTIADIGTKQPVPLPMFQWSGNKGSVLGGASLYGKGGIDFWTQVKTTTALWRAEDAISDKATVAMPTLS